jgi:hypothetical protein
MEGAGHDAIRRGSDFDEIAPSDLDGGNLVRRQSDEVCQQTADDGSVTDD